MNRLLRVTPHPVSLHFDSSPPPPSPSPSAAHCCNLEPKFLRVASSYFLLYLSLQHIYLVRRHFSVSSGSAAYELPYYREGYSIFFPASQLAMTAKKNNSGDRVSQEAPTPITRSQAAASAAAAAAAAAAVAQEEHARIVNLANATLGAPMLDGPSSPDIEAVAQTVDDTARPPVDETDIVTAQSAQPSVNETDISRAQQSSKSRDTSKPRLIARKSKEEWVKSLGRSGWEGLLCGDFSLLQRPGDYPSHVGISSRYWVTQVEKDSTSFMKLRSHYTPPSGVGMYRLSEHLESGTILSTLMSDITSLLQSIEGKSLRSSPPHLIFASSGGLSWDYLYDETPPQYRCFLYMGTEYCSLLSDEFLESEESARLGHAFVATADMNTIKTFGSATVLTMTALYREGHRKFRMHTGDIVIFAGGYPFAVDLPIFHRVVKSRMLTWAVYETTGSTNAAILPFPKRMPLLEDLIDRNDEAMTFYQSELTELEGNPVVAKDIGDTNEYMERLRVTPTYYEEEEINTRIRVSNEIHDVTEWIK